MQKRPFMPYPNPSESRALQPLVTNPEYQWIPISFIIASDGLSSVLRSISDSGWAIPWGSAPFFLLKRLSGFPIFIPSGHSLSGLLLLSVLSAMDKKPSASKPSLSPQERIEQLRAELESIKATTAKHKWEMLAIEMQDIKDDLTDELQAGLKDAANLMGNLGKRLSALELQVEGLTNALGKISEATAEASKKDR